MTRFRPKIGVYCPGSGTGGPWRYVHSILRGVDVGEFDVVLFCDLAGGYEPRPEIAVVRLSAPGSAATAPVPPSDGVASAPAPRGRMAVRWLPKAARLWAGFGRDARRLARVLRPHALDLFHTQNTGCEESPVAARLAGGPTVIGTFHVDSTCDLHGRRSGPCYRLLEAVSCRCLDRAIAVSRAAGADWVRRTRMGAARVTTIHNGIDPETFRRRSSPAVARGLLGLPNDGRPVVGSTGRLDEAKGYSFLLDAVARLRGRGHDLVVAIAGDGPDRKHLEYLAAQLGIADAVRFLGFQRDVQPVLDALDLFVLPSLTETLGYSLLEAMATELPTIGSRVGGIPEVIVPGQTGLLVPPRDPDALTAAIEQLIRSPALCRRMGSAGRERVVRHFHERDMVRKTIECYRAVLPRTRRRPCSNQANGDDRDNRSRHHQMA